MITVDAYNKLRVYLQYPDQSELLFKYQLQFTSPNDYAVNVEFYLRAKCIIVSSKFGQNLVVTSHSKQFDIFGPSSVGMRVSRILLFDHKQTENLAIGLTTGNCIVKLADKLMKDENVMEIRSENSSVRAPALFHPFEPDEDSMRRMS